MTGSQRMPNVTRGAAFFLRHALELVSEARYQAPLNYPFRESFESHAARISGVLKLLSNGVPDFSADEREGLVDTLRVARDLVLAARQDPRWELLAFPGDPVGEIADLLAALGHGAPTQIAADPAVAAA